MDQPLTSQQLLHNSYHLSIRSSLLAIQCILSRQETILQSNHSTVADIKSAISFQNATLQRITKTLAETFPKISSFQPPPSSSKPPTLGSAAPPPAAATFGSATPQQTAPPPQNSNPTPPTMSQVPATGFTTQVPPSIAPTIQQQAYSHPPLSALISSNKASNSTPIYSEIPIPTVPTPSANSLQICGSKPRRPPPLVSFQLGPHPHNNRTLNPLRTQKSMSSPNLINGVALQKTLPLLKIKRLFENATTPSRVFPLSAGYDLSAVETKVPAQGKALIPTDLRISISDNTYARITPRSGLARKHSIDVGPGVIDADNRGPVGVIFFNHFDVDFEVNIGDRIALVERIEKSEAVEDSIPYNGVFLDAFEKFHDSAFRLCGPAPSKGENGSHVFFDVDHTDVLALGRNEDEKNVYVFDPGGNTFDIKGCFVTWLNKLNGTEKMAVRKKRLNKCNLDLEDKVIFEGTVMMQMLVHLGPNTQ